MKRTYSPHPLFFILRLLVYAKYELKNGHFVCGVQNKQIGSIKLYFWQLSVTIMIRIVVSHHQTQFCWSFMGLFNNLLT
jgi:hypothetical protein